MKWTRVQSEIVYTSRRLTVRRNLSRSERTGRTHEFHLLEFADWVTVIPLTADDHVVMVRQHRHGIDAPTLEFPAGILDPEDPSPADAALRELREETGYSAAKIEPLGVLHPNPATQHNQCHIFVADGAELAGPTNWDSTEEIVIERVPRGAVADLIRRGEINNALAVAAWQLCGLRV